MTAPLPSLRLGIDLGGTKIAGAVLDASGAIVANTTVPSPQNDYAATLRAICDVVACLEDKVIARCHVGIGMPGSLSPRSGLVQNSNSTWLNGQPFDRDLTQRLARPLRFANDANCFALSEATDGAGVLTTPVSPDAPSVGVSHSRKTRHTVFGVILGTGCGGGIVIDGDIVDGPLGIGGEWGHTPLPWPTVEELAIQPCWCGRRGCLETWISGTGLANDHMRVTRRALSCEQIALAAQQGDTACRATLDRHAHRLARGLAMITNLIDPTVIVLGGGLSSMPHLYPTLPGLMTPYVFADAPNPQIMPPRWGPTSGVRGAAWLWP